jgi:hypothetical protein
MTRKQALHKALEVMTDQEAVEKIHELLEALPLTGWSERTIFDTIDQFVLDHGKNPTATDFIPKGMPPHTVIKLRFGMTLGEFLERYYPQPKVSRKKQREIFIAEYKRIIPESASDFNEHKATGVPTWITFSRMFGIGRWLEWLKFCGLERKGPTLKARARIVGVDVISYNDLLKKHEAIPKIPEDFEKQHREFMVMMDKKVEEILRRNAT